MTNKELISIANMELRDQLEAERVKVKKLEEQLKIAINALKTCRTTQTTIVTDKREVMYIWDYALKKIGEVR